MTWKKEGASYEVAKYYKIEFILYVYISQIESMMRRAIDEYQGNPQFIIIKLMKISTSEVWKSTTHTYLNASKIHYIAIVHTH